MRASEPAGEILSEAKDLFAFTLKVSLVGEAGIELEPLCGRLSPQAKS
jgi:hypothetical protein